MTTVDNQQRPKKQQFSHHDGVADLMGDGRVELYAGFCRPGVRTSELRKRRAGRRHEHPGVTGTRRVRTGKDPPIR